MKTVIPIALGIMAVLIISGCISDSGTTGEIVNVGSMTPDEVLTEYLSYSSYHGISDNLDKIRSQKRFAAGIILSMLEIEEDATARIISINSDFTKVCEEWNRILGDQSFDRFISLVASWEQIEQKYETISREEIEHDPDTVKIKVKRRRFYNDTYNESEDVYETTFIIKKYGDAWKISDSIVDNKLASETVDLEQLKLDYGDSVKNREEVYADLKNLVDRYKRQAEEMESLKNGVMNVIMKVVPGGNIINIDISNYNNDSEKYVTSVEYYFEGAMFTDDYLRFMRDSSEIFESLFAVNSKIMQVQLTAKEKYKDDYGNMQERYLARSLMSRDTYNKINWESFEYRKLDKVTSVSYYGDSIYKTLRDLQDTMEEWDDFSSDYIGIDPCETMKEQCATYGECDDYDTLKSIGAC